MSLEDMIATLKRMRFLDHEDDSIETIEDILNEISLTADNSVIFDLCSVFHDEIEEPSIVSDLMETIFYVIKRNGLEDGLYKAIEGISSILPQANYCAKRFYRSILASEDLVVPYSNALKKVTPSKREEVINILKEIRDEQREQYSEKVTFILKQVI
ncbi:hypothetical protein [Priestia filamentosa]|uniref:hypothetical protein n=1 Tax=Priestia filamentosa TaxID=1402861 RepID=UPI003981EC44